MLEALFPASRIVIHLSYIVYTGYIGNQIYNTSPVDSVVGIAVNYVVHMNVLSLLSCSTQPFTKTRAFTRCPQGTVPIGYKVWRLNVVQ